MHTNPLTPCQRLAQGFVMHLRPAPLAEAVKRLIGLRRVQVDTQHGSFHVEPISNLGVALTQRGSYEPEMRRTLEMHLGPGKTFVDLGANEGYFTVIAAALCAPGGTVVAVEPQTRLLPVIQGNLTHNRSSGVRLIHAAVSDHAGEGTMHLTSSINSGGSGLHNACKYALPTQEVETMTLAGLLDLAELKQVDLMKVDIEGHEYEALMGSVEVFRSHRIKRMVMDFHPENIAERGKSCDHVLEMLAECGYQITKPFGHWVWSAPVP